MKQQYRYYNYNESDLAEKDTWVCSQYYEYYWDCLKKNY